MKRTRNKNKVGKKVLQLPYVGIDRKTAAQCQPLIDTHTCTCIYYPNETIKWCRHFKIPHMLSLHIHLRFNSFNSSWRCYDVILGKFDWLQPISESKWCFPFCGILPNIQLMNVVVVVFVVAVWSHKMHYRFMIVTAVGIVINTDQRI